MNTIQSMHQQTQAATLSLCLLSAVIAACSSGFAQGTISFNEPWIDAPGVVVPYKNYYEQGMWFRVVNSYGRPPVSDMWRISAATGASMPYNGTPFLHFARHGFDDYVMFSMSDGVLFGLVSVDLADEMSPSVTPRSLIFQAYRPGATNPFASAVFTTAGMGISSFETFFFPEEFRTGLSWVAITSTGWAMDNLVWIPEPSSSSMLILGLLALAARRRRTRNSVP